MGNSIVFVMVSPSSFFPHGYIVCVCSIADILRDVVVLVSISSHPYASRTSSRTSRGISIRRSRRILHGSRKRLLLILRTYLKSSPWSFCAVRTGDCLMKATSHCPLVHSRPKARQPDRISWCRANGDLYSHHLLHELEVDPWMNRHILNFVVQ